MFLLLSSAGLTHFSSCTSLSKQNVLGSSEAASKNTFLLKNRAESDYKGLNKGLAKTVLKVHLRLF